MIVLAIETCFNRCAACVYDAAAGRALAAEQMEMERGHAEALAPMVQRLLAKAALGVDAIARVAVTTGPGTFTGLRIGLSFARAFGLARNIPVIGLDSLSAVALSIGKNDGPWLIAHKAGQSGYYYLLKNAPDAKPEIMKGEDLGSPLAVWQGLVLGTGAEELVGQYSKLNSDAARNLPDLKKLAAYAANATPGEMPEPLYLREADAKPQASSQSPLRAAAAIDLPAIATLHQLSFAHGWSEADLASMLSVSGTQALVMEVAGKLAGFVVLRSILGESEIITLAVAPKQRKHGLGKSLMQAALAAALAQSVSRMFLEVSETNTAALALYKSCGFIETGRRKAYYETPDGRQDAVVMAKSLP
jgi:tRNA threonylcarbamoyladenosine biosynthesis protein TsaB